jgi:hypothetical protein
MVKKLFDLMNEQPVEPEMLPLSLVVRDSCGAKLHQQDK